MSQHKKHRGKSRSAAPAVKNNRPPWALLLAFGLMLIAGVFLLARASQSGQTGRTAGTADGSSSDSVAPVTGAPRVSVARSTIDHGNVKLNTTIDSVFMVKNVGDQDLIVQGEPRVELVEGC